MCMKMDRISTSITNKTFEFGRHASKVLQGTTKFTKPRNLKHPNYAQIYFPANKHNAKLINLRVQLFIDENEQNKLESFI